MFETLTKSQKNRGKANGITLVALVVTIVVLLILAGITIASITGDNGILGKVGEAKEQTDLAQIKEEVVLIWNETQIEVAGKGYTNDQIAKAFEDKLKQNDPDAKVTYQPSNNTFEVDYKDHMFEVQISGELTNNREEVIKDIEDALENVDKDATGEDKAEQIEDELNKKDPDSTAEYNPETGNTDVNHGGYEAEVDEDGKVTIKGPEKGENDNINIDTDGDGEPDINIDTDDDGDPDINIDTNGDGKPDINIDTDGDKEPDINIDTDDDGEPDINIDTNGDGKPDINIDTDGDGDPDVNIDTDDDKDPDINIDTNGDGKPDINIDTDDDGDPDINIDTNGDKKPDINIDTNGDGKPDLNIDDNDDGIPDRNIDTDGDGEPEVNIDDDLDGTIDRNEDTNGDKKPDINIDTDNDGNPDLNIDDNDDGIPDRNIDTDDDGEPEVNIDDDLDGTIDRNEDTDGDGKPDINIDTDDDGTPDVDIDTNGDKVPDKNVTKLAIMEQPVAVETISNTEDVSFNVTATGAESAGSTEEETITYQWYYNTTNSNQNGTLIDKATSSTYTIAKEDVTASISGRYYYCVVTQNYRGKTNVETTNAALLTVISPVEVTTQPTAVQAIEGANDVTYTVGASGNGEISYQWYYKTSQEGQENVILGANSSTYTIKAEDVTTDLNGRYYFAKVTQSYGTVVATATSSEALLTVAEKVNITKEPASVTVTEGSKATFEVEATGIGDVTYQWYKSTTNDNKNGTPIDKATSNSYTINNVTAEDNETYYYVIITLKYGSSTVEVTSSVAKLTVGNGVSVSSPSDVNTIAGVEDVTFEVEASGSGTFSYQWYKNTTDSNVGGTKIDGETESSYTISKENVTVALNNTYYYCVVTQNYGGAINNATSEAGALSVIAPAGIKVNPQAITAYENAQNVVFSVTATGEGNVTYQWYKNDTNSNQNGTKIDNATGNTYTISKENVTTDLNGTYYYVVVTQKYGSCVVTKTSEAAMLTVLGTTIDASEKDVTVYVNGSSKTVTLSGDNAGAFSIVTPANTTYATAEISESNNNELIITPIAAGETSVEVAEENGGKTITINIHVVTTTITATPASVTAYVGGASQKVTLGGENAGRFAIETAADGTHATAEINPDNNNELIITPVAEGDTSVVVKELNGNKTITVNIKVIESDITVSEPNVVIYAGGESKTVTIEGTSLGELSIQTPADEKIAQVELSGNNVTITPEGVGSTTVVIKESNGGKTVTINIEVKGTTITASPESVIAYVNGSNQIVTLGGDNAGSFSIEQQPETYATAEINPQNNKELIITPVSAGTTSVVVKEANGNKTKEIAIEVRETSIGATSTDVTAYVGGSDQTVTITGTYLGELSIETEPNTSYATAKLEGTTLTIHPVAEGETSVTVIEANGNKEVTIDIHVIQSNMTANNTNVTAYVGGVDQIVTIEGTDLGTLSISGEPDAGVATADLSGNTLTIKPVGDGKTSVIVKESNGNNTVTINITVLATSITSQNIEVYAGGISKQVTIEGLNMGTLTIEDGPDSTYATASIDGTTLTVIPTQTAGTTSLTLKEANGNQTARINITVTGTSIDASEKDVTVYVGGDSKNVNITGTEMGALSIETPADGVHAAAELSGNTLTIAPKAEGQTSVTIKESNGNKTVTVNITVKATSIDADNKNVVAYVGGNDQRVGITGTEMGDLSISGLNEEVATATVEGNNIIVIHPVGVGKTTATVTEGNGKQTVTINITVKATSIDATNKDVTLYVNGNSTQVEITGTEMGDLSIETPADGVHATAELSEKTLTITPVAEGQTSVTIKESNGNKTVTINITVKATSIDATNKNVTLYVNGNSAQIEITGTEMGELSITKPTETVATAELNEHTLIITPVGEGKTSVVVKEANGNKTVEIQIEVKATTLTATPESVTAYVNGSNQTVEITGDNAGTLSITKPTETVATAQLSGNTLIITPVGEGTTSVTVTEANGRKTVEIPIEVKATSIDANNKNVTLYVDGSAQTVEITGDNKGTLSATTEPQGIVETSIENSTLTITPVKEGTATITVKEANGGQTVEISVEVKTVTIAPVTGSVTLYVGGSAQTVGVTGTNYGTLSIVTPPTGTVATAEVASDNKGIIITPVGAGNTSVTVKEANANKEFTISIEVIQSTITAEPTSVEAYVGGTDKTVQISGTSIGNLSITDDPESTIATASLSGNTLTIKPVGSGDTSVEVTESNGNQKVTVDIHVQTTSITPQTVQVYAGGAAKTVTIEGLNMGTLTIEKGPDEGIAKASIEGTSLTVTPVAAGNTNLTLKESNGGKIAEIPINVLETSIEANPESVTANIGDGAQTVTLSGTNAGPFEIVTQPDGAVATAQLSGNTLTIIPLGGGTTSVTVKETNGNKQVTIDITIDNNVTAGNVPATDYGAKVNGYEYPNEASGIGWQLFYANDNNVYLIADDYIPYEYVPSNSAGHKPSRDPSYQRSVSIDSDLFNDYLGSDSITDEKLKALNNDFFNVKKYKSTYDNMKITAYMLDTDAWSVYAGDKAEYAIGGATVELFLKSYNKKYGTNYKAQATKPYYRENIGYQLSKNGGTSWDYGLSIKINDSTYAISSTTNALCALLASPSAYENYHEIGAFTGGLDAVIASDVFGTGLRPIVCLKSDVHLQKNSDGSYTIVEPPKNNNIEPSDYGATVKGYECTNSAAVDSWQLFYADDEHIYLIASNYLEYENVPYGLGGYKPERGDYSRYKSSICFDEKNTRYSDYKGSANITDARIKALNNDYFTKGYSSTYDEMKAVAYMLDINAWGKFAGEKAEYAVGGPSIELLMTSYSEKHDVDYRAQATNSTGYQISIDGGKNWDSAYMGILTAEDAPYVINSEDALGYWISSPSVLSYVFYVRYSDVSCGTIKSTDSYGFRPIVCLKPDTILKDNGDGTYTIK